MKKICENLKKIRELRNITLKELSESSGVAKTSIWEIESGKVQNPSVYSALALAKALDLTVEQLAEGEFDEGGETTDKIVTMTPPKFETNSKGIKIEGVGNFKGVSGFYSKEDDND